MPSCGTGMRMSVIATLFVATATCAASGAGWGIGLNVVSSYVARDSSRAGPSVQPSVWLNVPSINTSFSGWSSARLDGGELDDAVVDIRAGSELGTWGWVGLTSHTTWGLSTPERPADTWWEVGGNFTWFTPPYRPTLYLGYDLLQREKPILIMSVPYTIRTDWMPPTTFVPEFALRVGDSRRWFWHPSPEPLYFSFSGFMERRWRWLTVVPIVSVVIPSVPSGVEVPGWIFWAGVHISASR